MFSSALNRTTAVLCGAVALLTGPVRSVAAIEQNPTSTQSSAQTPLSPSARLQVSGSGDRLTVDVERGDVQSTLKAVLKQTGKQFVPDANVTGTVTLLLTDQPLDVVLRAVCDQSYLRYTTSPSGVYRFTRDDAAIKTAFSRLNELNASETYALTREQVIATQQAQNADRFTRAIDQMGSRESIELYDLAARVEALEQTAPAQA